MKSHAKTAPESTDVIWENLSYRRNNVLCRITISVIITILFIFFASVSISIIRGMFATVNSGLKWANSECPAINSAYKNEISEYKNIAMN